MLSFKKNVQNLNLSNLCWGDVRLLTSVADVASILIFKKIFIKLKLKLRKKQIDIFKLSTLDNLNDGSK